MKVVGGSGGLGITFNLASDGLALEVSMTKQVMIWLRVSLHGQPQSLQNWLSHKLTNLDIHYYNTGGQWGI